MAKFDFRDVPIENNSEDLLNMSDYAKCLASFINSSEMPLTISLQGEWGSGKSSLMNMIKNILCNQDMSKIRTNINNHYEAVWINAWDLSLRGDDDYLAEHVSYKIIRSVQDVAKKKGCKIQKEINDLQQSFKKVFFRSVDYLMAMNGADSSSRQNLISMVDVNDNYVESARKHLATIIERLVKSDNTMSSKGFIFFIDDLDRLKPSAAVRLLDVIKNLFIINNCVFILAIDYDVISKGLISRYSEDTTQRSSNIDKLSKSYFDKLIQLPFVMPVNKYDIHEFVKSSLEKAGYLSNAIPVSDIYFNHMVKAIQLSIGTNPRAIKRLVNSVKLSKILDDSNHKILNDEGSLLINLLFICMQTSYPAFYTLFSKNCNYKSWSASSFHSVIIENLPVNASWTDILSTLAKKDPETSEHLDETIEFINYLSNIFTVCESCNSTKLKQILFLSSLTNMGRNDDSFVYSGIDYDNSSQTQKQQGTKLIEILELSNGINVLDVGCGNGETTIELYRKNPTIYIDAFDISASQIKIAQEKSEIHGINENKINFYQKNAKDISYKSKYDLVFSNAAMHWLYDDPEDAYKRIFDALKPNGTLAVHQGGAGSYKELHDMVKKAIIDCHLDEYYSNWTFSIFYPEKTAMEEMLNKLGFVDIDITLDSKVVHNDTVLIENFANASLLPYYEPLDSDIQKSILKDKFLELCKISDMYISVNRLYILARKSF